jgi:hypothetical protein
VDAVVAAAQDLAKSLETEPHATLAGLLQVFVGRLVVDLETREIELEVALPPYADAAMWLDGTSACKPANEPHRCPRAVIAAFRAEWDQPARRYGRPEPMTRGAAA